MKDRVFRSMAEYLEYCKPKPVVKGSKYYRLGAKAAEDAIRKCKEDAGIAQW